MVARDDEQDDRVERQLAWSEKQGRILTANGKAAEYFTAERGFAYKNSELPHYYFFEDNAKIFREWRQRQTAIPPVVGAWKRPLFYGGWESSTDRDEDVYNLQTESLFVDLRLPTTRLRRPGVASLQDLTAEELQQFARQHVFAGYTVTDKRSSNPKIGSDGNTSTNIITSSSSYPYVCTRHHCIDWNFAGTPRNRPNKWWVELQPDNSSSNNNNNSVWKEWAYATDPHGQHYYCERWERLPGDDVKNIRRPVVALRRQTTNSSDDYGRDGVLVIVGDHFNYCLGRSEPLEKANVAAAATATTTTTSPSPSSLVGVVDAALQQGNLDVARRWLSIQACHGRISPGWKIDAAIQYWMEGQSLWEKQDVRLEGSNTVIWNADKWQVFESNLDSPRDLEALLWTNL